ncbi:hypothetical protein [Nonomuraea dietziae]|uniref:hypothetical protein n=1 Tax=Nonomuraea dietziae TaxID=65515 RepID=UPI0031CEA444
MRGVTLLTEAEVLALRFPAQAARLLEQASVLLGRDSELGRQAALLAAMAGIRSGAPLEAGRREPAKPLSGGWVVRTTALSRLSWTTSVSGLPELALPDLSRPSLPQWVYGGEQPLGRPDQSADDPTRGERGSDRLLPTRRRPPADAREQPDDGSPHPQRRPSVNDQDPAPTTAEDEPESEWISGWKIAAVLVAFVGVVAFQAFLPQIMSALGPTVVVAGCVLAAAAGAVHWSGILSTAMTAEISDGSTDLLLHGSGEWRGQAWGPGVPTWLAPSRHVATVRTTWHEARPRPWVKAVRLVSTNRVIDGDVEFGLFGHLPPARLPAMFRSFHSRARLTPVSPQGDYRGPDHLAPRALSGGRALWVGTLVRTADGLRLRVADDRSAPSGAQSRERLMDLAPPPDFVVLQAEPVDGPPEPLGSAHALAASLARALCEGGTPAALVVPPLPDELAAQVIAACADWPMWRQGEVLDARSLLRLQRHLRKIIGAGSEVLCDLILFLPIDPEDE